MSKTPKLADVYREREVSLKIETITPEKAYELLAGNTNNRRLRDREVAKYSRDMKAGRWRRGAGEPVHIAPDGELGNGQHRLMAIVESDTTVDLPILRAPIEYREIADQGLKRQFADVLKIEYGEENVKAYAAAVRLLWEFETNGSFGRITIPPSTSDLIEVYLRHPEMKLSLPRGQRAGIQIRIRPAVSIALHYLFAKVDHAAADTFFDRLADGVGLQEKDPILAARRWFFGRARSGGSAREQATVLIKAFNNARSGRRSMYYKGTEEFPQIEGLTRLRDGVEGAAGRMGYILPLPLDQKVPNTNKEAQ